MTDYDDGTELTNYIWNHFPHFFTPAEARVRLAVHAQQKAAIGSEAMAKLIRRRHGLDEDPIVRAELAEGADAFRRRAATRVLTDHRAEVFVNRCPRCNRVVRTPKAQQCLWCGFDWHPPQAPEVAAS
jgi:hypothetical protein